MNWPDEVNRREFLRVSASSGMGLALAFHLPGFVPAALAVEAPAVFAPNAWLRIEPDGTTVVVVNQVEMGQGVYTALPMILAEELDADWRKVRFQPAPADSSYANPLLGGAQSTLGSTSVKGAWLPLREAGATARAMLVAAAAAEWGASPEMLRTEAGVITHPDGRRLTYGEVAGRAASMPVPSEVRLKEPAQFRLIGRSMPRLDLPAKVNGTAVFGIDVKLPGLLTAVVVRCPVFGGKLLRYDAAAALRVAGVRQVVPISSGVAVIADGYWSAKRGRELLDVEWDEGDRGELDSTKVSRRLAARARETGMSLRTEGDAATALAGAATRLEAIYELPFLAHAPMEPINATAHVTRDRCTVWAPTQSPGWAREAAARAAGLPEAAIEIHTTFLGGGFGRRLESDFVTEAVEVSRAAGAPVKVVWSREEDIQHDFYRPAAYNRLEAGLDGAGQPVAWTHTLVSPSTRGASADLDGPDIVVVDGAATHPYPIPNVSVTWVREELGVPVGPWRGIGGTVTTFAIESFIDELAAAAGRDPYEYRRTLLAEKPRHRAVLDLAAERAGWGTPLPPGKGRGIALAEYFAIPGSTSSFVAQVAEVTAEGNGAIHVDRVICAIDCGIVVNPDTVQAQMEGGVIFGLSAALTGVITLKDGRVEQSNFHDYRILRLYETPAVEVHIVPSQEPPGGVAEIGVQPVAPAVANAMFAATGRRIRRLPILAS
jgi:isoquinoline 1-oxidoreductase subunit beta